MREFKLLGMSLESTCEDKIRNFVGGRKPLISILTAEFLGTCVFVFIGNSSVAQNVVQEASFIDINLAYGLGVAFGVYVSIGISGGHINPAVTISQYILGNINLKQLLAYISGQLLGAFTSACLTYAVYADAIKSIDPDLTVPGYNCTTFRCTPTAGIFATYPNGAYQISTPTLFLDQLVGTLVLVLVVSSMTDKNYPNAPSAEILPLLIGLLVVALGLCMGLNCGYALNPARDLGPRIFTSFVYGKNVFLASNMFFWIPIVAPILGGTLGALIYLLMVGGHFGPPKQDEL